MRKEGNGGEKIFQIIKEEGLEPNVWPRIGYSFFFNASSPIYSLF